MKGVQMFEMFVVFFLKDETKKRKSALIDNFFASPIVISILPLDHCSYVLHLIR
jgi:hypothetical protein